jgi:hypothetical protein
MAAEGHKVVHAIPLAETEASNMGAHFQARKEPALQTMDEDSATAPLAETPVALQPANRKYYYGPSLD